jgi:DNA polymerase delta subunit 2
MNMEITDSLSLLSLLGSHAQKSTTQEEPLQLARLCDFNYKNTGERFQFKKKNFEAHFTHLYFSRLAMLRPQLEKKLKNQHMTTFSRIIDIRYDSEATIIGTLYKEMKMKPSVLHRMNLEQTMGIEKFKDYTASDDYLHLEDESGRVMLDFSEYVHNPNLLNTTPQTLQDIVDRPYYSPRELLTGMVVAVTGRVDNIGHIFVKKVFFPDLQKNESEVIYQNIKSSLKVTPGSLNNCHDISYYCSSKSDHDDKFIAVVSGLNMKHDKSQLAIRSFIQFLTGQNPLENMNELSHKIIRLVIAGDTVEEEKDLLVAIQGAFKIQELYQKMYGEIGKTMRVVDDIVEELVQSITVDIMPGENDPSDEALPQQPLNRAYFPKSYNYGQLSAVTNPYEFCIDDTTILGTSGQNIKDAMQFANVSDKEIEILEHSLYWNHIAPTGPDTLKCHPYSDDDPFVLRTLPHIYFVGNMKQFSTKLFLDETEESL